MKKLSAILPNYNHGKYLNESIKALLSQTTPPHEIIVIDDGSTDNSLEVLAQIQSRNPEIRIEKNHHNLGFFKTAEKRDKIS